MAKLIAKGLYKEFEFLKTTYRGPCLIQNSLVRISLLQFFETFHKYSPYANFGLFISLVPFFGQKIAKQSQFDIVSLTWNLLSTNNKILLVLVTFKNSNSFDSDTV